MRQNTFDKLYDICNNGINEPTAAPVLLDIELTNTCNLRCMMCPTGRGLLPRPKGFMSEEMFRDILSQVYMDTGIRFIRWGEPLLHPQLLRFVELAKRSNHPVHINTNGMFIDEEFVDRILKLKLDSIKFSFQGIDKESYERTRKGADFGLLLGAIRILCERRGNQPYPYVQIATTVEEGVSETDIDIFKKAVGGFADRVDVGRTRDLFGSGQETNFPSCPEMFNKLSINWNGEVVGCCGDWDNALKVGDLKSQSLAEIWTGDSITEFRKMLVANRHNELPHCRNCRL